MKMSAEEFMKLSVEEKIKVGEAAEYKKQLARDRWRRWYARHKKKRTKGVQEAAKQERFIVNLAARWYAEYKRNKKSRGL